MKTRVYDKRWQRLSRRVLRNHPFCATPGCKRPSVAVDHIVPVKVAPYRRYDETNLQALCQPCHNRITVAYERGSIAGACDDDGMPLDPGHPWAQPDNAAATRAANVKPTFSPFFAAQLKARYAKKGR